MNIAAKAVKNKKRAPQRLLTATMMLFFFLGFLLLFLKKPSPQTALVAVCVPAALFLLNNYLPKLFPIDNLLLSLVNFLCALGILLQYRFSASRGMTQAFNCVVGLVAMIGCALIVRHIKNWRILIPLIMLGCCGLLSLPFIFRAANAGKGATAWVGVGGMSMQPSEIVKIAFLFVLAYFLSRRRVLPALCFIGVMLGFLVLQRDLGTAAIYCGTAVVLLYAATSSLLLIGGILGAGVGGVAAAYMLFKDSFFITVQNRINNWLDPWSTYDQLGGGYQIVQSLIAIANGGMLGTGLGAGNASVIPEYSTDFIFSVMTNEFGLFFSIVVVLIYALIVLRGADIALRSSSAFHALLALGCAATLAVQIFIIVGGVIKFIPMTGVTVPFLSYGGTSIVSCMGLMGVLQGVASRNERLLREDEKLADAGEGGEDAV